jgi:hypothetical protein
MIAVMIAVAVVTAVVWTFSGKWMKSLKDRKDQSTMRRIDAPAAPCGAQRRVEPEQPATRVADCTL